MLRERGLFDANKKLGHLKFSNKHSTCRARHDIEVPSCARRMGWGPGLDCAHRLQADEMGRLLHL